MNLTAVLVDRYLLPVLVFSGSIFSGIDVSACQTHGWVVMLI
jgi:hypothetical protein